MCFGIVGNINAGPAKLGGLKRLTVEAEHVDLLGKPLSDGDGGGFRDSRCRVVGGDEVGNDTHGGRGIK